MNQSQIIEQKLFRLNVNFVYEELLNQFVNNNGDCKLSTFWLISWGIICDPKNTGKSTFFFFLIS